jgi:hypothetical protein
MNYTLNRAFAFDQQGGGNIPSEEIISAACRLREKGGKSLRYMMHLKDSNGATSQPTRSATQLRPLCSKAVYAEKEGLLRQSAPEKSWTGWSSNLKSFLKESYPFGIKWLVVGDVEKYWRSLNQPSAAQEFSYII